MDVKLSYGGWTKAECAQLNKAGVEGILVPKTASGRSKVVYHTRLWFGGQVMYIQMKPDWDTPRPFWQMHIVPYRNCGEAGPVKNSAYIRPGQ